MNKQKLRVKKAAGFQKHRPSPRISKQKASHFKANGRFSLQILDRQNRLQKLEPVVPCEWMNSGTIWLAICRNPYPTAADNHWLLCNPEGTACFAGPTAETARIFFYRKTKALQVAKAL